MSSPTPEHLRSSGAYILLETIGHKDIILFVLEYYRRQKSSVVWFHYFASFLTVGLWIGAAIADSVSIDHFLSQIGWATMAFLPILVIHEAIHGAVYRAHGARDIRFGGSLRQLYAYAIAHLYVADRKTFRRVAYAPFILISGFLLAAAWLFPLHRIWLLGLLALHTGGCAGDFAMMNFYALRRSQTLFTFDDAENQISYIYAEKPITSSGFPEPAGQ